ncbi:MAG: M15 family metallopeptidase [Bacteroidota bacterium]
MSRSPVFTAVSGLLALAVGVALVAPAGCSDRAGAEAAPPSDAPARLVADTLDTDSTEAAPPEVVRPDLPEGFIRLRDVAPLIAHEIRYTTPYNFVGEVIDGYEAPECILTTEAAEALGRVADDLARDGLGLKVYDCYRPQPAVDHFVRWIYTDDRRTKTAFYPEEPKNTLFRRGYIARRSGHSRGSTVDLTLVDLPAAASVLPDSVLERAMTDQQRCDRPRGERLDEGDRDMGTGFDCFTHLSATESPGVSAEARRNRYRLREAMSRRGFRNYSKEWWHFTLRNEPHRDTYFDFPVQ